MELSRPLCAAEPLAGLVSTAKSPVQLPLALQTHWAWGPGLGVAPPLIDPGCIRVLGFALHSVLQPCARACLALLTLRQQPPAMVQIGAAESRARPPQPCRGHRIC